MVKRWWQWQMAGGGGDTAWWCFIFVTTEEEDSGLFGDHSKASCSWYGSNYGSNSNSGSRLGYGDGWGQLWWRLVVFADERMNAMVVVFVLMDCNVCGGWMRMCGCECDKRCYLLVCLNMFKCIQVTQKYFQICLSDLKVHSSDWKINRTTYLPKGGFWYASAEFVADTN